MHITLVRFFYGVFFENTSQFGIHALWLWHKIHVSHCFTQLMKFWNDSMPILICDMCFPIIVIDNFTALSQKYIQLTKFSTSKATYNSYIVWWNILFFNRPFIETNLIVLREFAGQGESEPQKPQKQSKLYKYGCSL